MAGSAGGPSVEQITSAYGLRTLSHLNTHTHLAHDLHVHSALKLRYSLPIVLPNSKRREGPGTRPGTPAQGTPLSSPQASTVSFPSGIAPEDVIVFDAPLVARMEEGWELMLERVVFKWVDAVVSERRGER